ncbi:MAG: TonB-dependent receptor [Candidatus Zixiibacteriota bacterium]
MKKSLMILVLVLFAAVSAPLAMIIDGTVTDREGNPIEGVNVLTDISSLHSRTDQNGAFELNTGEQIPEHVTFSHVSYQPFMMQVKSGMKSTGFRIMLDQAVYPGQKIKVTAMRAETGLTPVAFSDFTDEDVERDYTVEDFPMLLETTPNMYAYSYTGGTTGASDYKIRGFDSQRIGTYINGIPLNDPEDRFTYFYDMADFAAEVEDIQVQRGVGNSLYGDATFGGSINIASAGLERVRKVSVSSGYGQYFYDGNRISDVRKQSVEFSSGLLDGRWSLAGRYSKLYSGGFREYAWYDGYAYFLSLSRLDPNMTTTINIYGGPMQAHLAFNGIDRYTEAANRRTNWDSYANEIDDFNQPHYELHNTYKLGEYTTLKNTFYYIRGKGYYEQYKSGRDIYEYNIPASSLIDENISEIDLVRQKWVTKNQYGWNPSLDWDHTNGTAIFGGAFYYFDSEHWGQVIWAENLSNSLDPRHRYYEYFGKKMSASVYGLEYYSLTDKIKLMGNLQFRYLRYDFDQTRLGALPGYQYGIDWAFVSPRTGITYLPSKNSDIYFSFAVASREPADVTIYDAEEVSAFPNLIVEDTKVNGDGDTLYTFGDPIIKPERVYDFELGGNIKNDRYKAGLNLYWMEFRNEIIPEGDLNDDGLPRLGNAERSVHAGMEFEGKIAIDKHIALSGNFSYSYNRLKEYIVYKGADSTIDYAGNPTAGFPDYIGNLMIDYDKSPFRLTYQLRAIGKQYVENGKNEDLAIGRFMVSAISGSVSLGNIDGFGRLTLSARVDNLFNAKYEQAGYAYEWDGDWYGEYYPAAERNFFAQIKWEFE